MKRFAVSVLALVAFVVSASRAHADSVTPGESFTIDFTETVGAHPGTTGTADVTVGAQALPGIFDVSSFSVIELGDCLSCTLNSLNLGGVLFDGSTLDLMGVITGSFTGQGGGTNTFSLTLTGMGFDSWLFTEMHASGAVTMAAGTYSTVVGVPEPSSVLLLGAGLLGICGIWRRRLMA